MRHFLGWDLIVDGTRQPSVGKILLVGLISMQVLLSKRASTQGILVASWPTRAVLSVEPLSLRLGERVEVEYDGLIYVGVLHAVDSEGMASIRCDADPPGVMTVTPLSCVHRASPADAQDALFDSVFHSN